MFRNVIVYILLGLSMATIIADERMPVLEFVKDGKVIETREMTSKEYKAYKSLKTLEAKLEKLEGPLKDFGENIEVEAELIEAEVQAVIDETIDVLSTSRSLSDLSRLSVLGDMKFEEIDSMLEEMQPLIDAATDMAEDISETANTFKDSIMKDYQDDEIDQIRILDGSDGKVIIGKTNLTIDL